MSTEPNLSANVWELLTSLCMRAKPTFRRSAMAVTLGGGGGGGGDYDIMMTSSDTTPTS